MRRLMLSFAVIGFAVTGLAASMQPAAAAPLPHDRESCTKMVKSNPAYMLGNCKCICGPACGDAIRRCMHSQPI